VSKPTTVVRAVHRVHLDVDRFGCITAGPLDSPVQVFGPGASVVLEVAEGWWMHEHELARMLPALRLCRLVSITGTHVDRGGGRGDFGIIYGLSAIAARLESLLVGENQRDVAAA
jgi:hypothetical protein